MKKNILYIFYYHTSYDGQNIILENFMLRVKKKYDNLSILIHKKKRFIMNLIGLKYHIINREIDSRICF